MATTTTTTAPVIISPREPSDLKPSVKSAPRTPEPVHRLEPIVDFNPFSVEAHTARDLLASTRSYHAQKARGQSVSIFKNRQKLRLTQWRDGNTRHGVEIHFDYRNQRVGSIMRKCPWIGNLRHGTEEVYDRDGQRVSIQTWSGGVLDGPFEHIYSDGSRKTGQYRNGRLHGWVKLYNMRDRLLFQQCWSNGRPNSDAVWYFRNGRIHRIARYNPVTGKRGGDDVTFCRDGTVRKIVPWRNGARHGVVMRKGQSVSVGLHPVVVSHPTTTKNGEMNQ